MNAPFSQATRLGKLHTALGTDKIVLLRFSGTDHVNDLFEYRVEALSADPKVDFDALVGTHASVELLTQDGGTRWFDGIVTTARWAGVDENGNRCDLVLRPWAWLAGRRRTQRIFHQMTAPDILGQVMGAYGHLGTPAFEDRLTESYPVLEYTVQYRESDLDFCRRIMERFGISFHFTHQKDSHTLVLSDTAEEHDEVPGGARKYLGSDGHHHSEEEHFWEWSAERNLTTGAIRLTDYNFKTPDAAMEVERLGDAAHPEGTIESYDYPGDYLAQTDGKDRVVGLRVRQERARDPRHRAVGDCMSLAAGLVFQLTGEEAHGASGQRFVVLSASHSYVSDAYASGGAGSEGYSFTGSYEMMPATTPLAPPRVTPVPVVHGPQTARVVGEGEIDCDEYGRILVHFPWDLAKAHSMRCRVSQNWASKGWGGMVIPRIGMEVVVEFLEGDPDKPLVTGCVYNGKNDPPYPLPANKTRSTFKTDTHQGKGFNELRFEDKAGEEEIFVHAQKDQNLHVENNRTLRVDNNEVQSVGNHRYSEVSQNQTQLIGGNLITVVGGAEVQALAGEKIQAGAGAIADAARELGLPGLINPLAGNMVTAVAKNQTSYIALSSTAQVGRTMTTTVGTSYTLSVGATKSEMVESTSTESVGTSKLVHAGESFEVRVGKSLFRMDADGTILLEGVTIKVKGKDIKLEGDATIVGEAPKIGFN